MVGWGYKRGRVLYRNIYRKSFLLGIFRSNHTLDTRGRGKLSTINIPKLIFFFKSQKLNGCSSVNCVRTSSAVLIQVGSDPDPWGYGRATVGSNFYYFSQIYWQEQLLIVWKLPHVVVIQVCSNHDPGGRIGPQYGVDFLHRNI